MRTLVACGVMIALITACESRVRRPLPIGHEALPPARAAQTMLTADAGVAPVDAGPVGPVQSRPPPAVSGGTLYVTRDGRWAVAADPDRDVLWIADLASAPDPLLHGAIPLVSGDHPTRIVEDDAGRLHVVLRGAGELLTVDPGRLVVLDRRAVCPAPRGLAWDEGSGSLHVVCAGGELVTLAAGGGPPHRLARLGSDLRDVVAVRDGLFVSRFRSAEILRVDRTGTPVDRVRLPDVSAAGSDVVRTPTVAWRMRPAADGDGVTILHQRAVVGTVRIEETGYGGGACETGVVESALSRVTADGTVSGTWTLDAAALAVDFVNTGHLYLVAVASFARHSVRGYRLEDLEGAAPGACVGPWLRGGWTESSGHATSVAITPDGRRVAFSREPAQLLVGSDILPLPGRERDDGGLRLFHESPGSVRISCASCHPEGRDDGHVWVLSTVGAHRTQSLTGGVLDTAPYHWRGDVADIESIVRTTFVERMFGGYVWPAQVDALADWLHALPAVPASVTDPAAVERGRVIFESASVGCASCHAGPQRTDGLNHDVGTGEPLQTPPLVGVASRGPWLHDGCAESLEEAVAACGVATGLHGDVSALPPQQLEDLLAYVRSL